MTKPKVIIVGADKGGVGKTTNCRAIVDYLDGLGVSNRLFDTENEIKEGKGSLKRFYPDRAEIVDLNDSDGQMRVFDTLNAATATVIDIKASVLSPTLQLLKDIGFLDPDRIEVTVMHILGNNQTSIDEVGQVAALINGGARHVLIGNRINATKFTFPPDALDIPMLAPAAAEAADAFSKPFSVFRKSHDSAVMRGLVGTWLDRVFAQYASKRIP